ncbi:MAG: putative lipid II flippase FtsW [Treponema sp.]|nr:putative lipid II flippase FtsW [Treponema sp.]
MSTQFEFERRKTDHILVANVLLLTGLGLVTLYSASYGFAHRWFDGNGYHFISRQIVFAVVGIILFYLASIIDLNLLRKFIKPMVLGAIILCILTFVPGIGVSKNGAARWVGFGSFTYQPSEIVKLILPLYMAHYFEKKDGKLDSILKGVLPPALIVGVFFVLIFLQNNISTGMFIAFNALFMFYLAGIKLRYFLGAVGVFLPTAALLVLQKEHRVRRFINFIRPTLEPWGAGFQANASELTISSGGFWGKGIGLGTRKIGSVPEVHSDFIFAAYAEEAGFIGIILFFVLFAVFAGRGYMISMKNEKPFNRMFGCGLVTMIISQVFLNIAVVAGALPVTGVPLPFFSAGGSSLLTTLIMAGLIVNISRQSNDKPAPGEVLNG